MAHSATNTINALSLEESHKIINGLLGLIINPSRGDWLGQIRATRQEIIENSNPNYSCLAPYDMLAATDFILLLVDLANQQEVEPDKKNIQDIEFNLN